MNGVDRLRSFFTTQLPYNERQRCHRHPDQIAAICPDCHDAAVKQAQYKDSKVSRRLHVKWLEKQREA